MLSSTVIHHRHLRLHTLPQYLLPRLPLHPVLYSVSASLMAETSDSRVSPLDGAAPESTDFANYFCTYAYLYHQKEMLEDHKRTGAYFQAVMSNRRQFLNKVVLDVGTGSGILSIFAAKAGAKKVYAVEATDMAQHARKLVAHNKLENVIEVIQGTIETIDLPEKVDIIISEWMGYFLLRESMLDSVLVARDKFLKPGGALYPSHANMFMVPIRSHASGQRVQDLQGSMEAWAGFLQDMQHFYQVDLDVLGPSFHQEQNEYYLHTSQWTDTHPQQMLGSPTCFKRFDLHKLTLEELKAPMKVSFDMHVADGGPVEALCGYFDVLFKGSEENPADNDVKLSTAPDAQGATHWGQQVFFVQPPIACEVEDVLHTSLLLTRKPENHRLLRVQMQVQVRGPSGAPREPQARQLYYNIE
ncbi:S-adenosyl-L-methionine-dependent methyltransferase [Haematococcus lacustris]